ncbi:MAG: FmdB family zinc ribbon protein [Acidimicrobiales bacterium]
MPTYEYACKSCGEHLEVVQSFKDAALTECPACGAKLRKVFGNIGIAFKGTGFYKTDSRSAPSAAAAGSSKGAGDSVPAKSDGAPPKSDGDSSTAKPSGTAATAGSSTGSGSSSGSSAAAS